MNFNKSFFTTIILSLCFASNLFAIDFYWVGNSGNWTDPTHWSNSSGGVGGAGIPTLNDDVYFDENSFSQNGDISINSAVSCNSFIFDATHQIEFSSSINQSLTINNTFLTNAFFENKFFGKIIFSSNQTQTTISSNGKEFLGDLEFNGSGSWLLSQDLITTDSNYIYLKQGELIANNVTIFSGGIDVQSNQSKTLNLNNAVVYNHDKALFNSTNFSLIKNQSELIINGNASLIDHSNIPRKDITYSANTKLTNTCGVIPFTVTTSVLISNPGGFGVSCDATCDATTFVTVTGGVGPFTYLWSATGTPSAGVGDTLFNTCQGNVGIQVTDVGQGTQCTDQVFVTNPIGLVVNLVQAIDPTCNGDCDGSISTNVAFGSPPYAISWAQVPDITASISNLCEGSYDITVVDTNGCTTSQNYALVNPNFISFQLDSTNILCAAECTGAATVSAEAGGNGAPYNYAWTSNPAGQVPAAQQGTSSLSGLCPGVYTVTVSDGPGCFLIDSVTITIPDTIQIDSSQTNVSCGGICDGTITSTVLGGGVGPFTHHWNVSPFIVVGNTSNLAGLCAGTYTDSIVDANGCDTVITFIITEPVTLITSSNANNVSCFGFCDGTIATNASGGTAPYSYLWSSNVPGPIQGQGTDSIFDLCPGEYIVVITDNNLCVTNDTIVITEPTLLISNPSSTDASCFGICDGTTTANPTGGTGDPAIDFIYTWNGPGGPYNNQSVNSLCPGNYELIVTDANGCMDTTTSAIIEPPALNLAMSSIGITCNAICDGSASVIATGGTGNPATDFTYTWVSVPTMAMTGQGTPNITDLCAGSFTVTVVDANGCSENNNITVNEPPAIVLNLSKKDLSCNGICNGTATVAPTGGNGPYSVSWNGSAPINIPTGGSNTETGLCAGAQDVVVTDNNNCSVSLNFNVVEPPLLTTSTAVNILSCNGVCNGSATTTPAGGSGNYTYNWTSIPTGQVTSGQGTPSINSLCAGTYFVSVTDDSLCIVIDTIVITEPLAIDPNILATDITCKGLNNGTAVALPTGGTAPYASITWSSIPAGTVIPGNPINNLVAGQYEIAIIDASGCSGIDTITIIDPPAFTVDATPISASCGTVCNGVIEAITSGGTGNPALDFTYQWNDPALQTSAIASNLCAGVYTVTVNDANGCVAIDSDTVVTIVTISIVTNAVNNGCNTLCDGAAIASGNGGLAPYTYTWTSNPPGTIGVAPGDSIFNLCQGFVYITVTDANGCATTDSAFVPAAPSVFQLNPTVTDVICNGDSTGSATIAPSGGVAPYSNILWSTGQSILSINNLPAGTYWATATDNVGCTVTDSLIVVDQPDTIAPNPTIIDILCNGDSTGSICLAPTGGTAIYSFLWAGGLGINACIINQPAGNYPVTITDANGCSRTEIYTIQEPTIFSSNPFSMDVSCFGDSNGVAAAILSGGTSPYSCSWNTGATTDTILNLAPGNYSVICLDDNGCSTNQNITIDEPDLLDANVSGTSIACGGTPCTGTAISNPLGGTAGYSFQWSAVGGNPISPNPTSNSINNLCQDTYNVIVTDDNGCISNGQFIVSTPTTLNVVLDSTNVSCNGGNNGTVTASATGGTLPYSYSWVGGCLTTADTNQTVTNLCAGTYTVTIIDALGCFFSGSINVNEPSVIEINEIITPANCGVNDGVIATFPAGGTNPYTHSWNNGATTSTITSLVAGFYTDTITDFNGCTTIFTIAVTNPSAPSGVVTTVNDASCFGVCDASLNVLPIGGNAPYTYSWASVPVGGPYPNDSTLTGLCQGTYNLIVTDASGCIFATSILVGQADSINANLSFNDASCSGVCDGTASISPTGGTAPYSYLWSNGATSSSISGLCASPLSVIITDFNGCTKIENFDITSPNSLTLLTTTIDATCNSTCNGSATVVASGGNGNYTYQWNDGLSQTTATANNLCAGTYIVTVNDVNGCSMNDTIIINEPSLIVPNITTIDATCGNNDGSATANPTGGTGPYTFLWCNNVAASTTNGLAAGTCTLEITDANGCSQTFLVPINNSNGPILSIASTDASCNGVCDGTASVVVTSGAPNYTYLWSNGATTTNISGLCAGNYTVDVTDMNGCVTVQSVTINESTTISATVSVIDASCNGICNGSAIITPFGGLPPYNYSWNTGQTANAIGGLCPNNYTVTITDANGCSIVQNVLIDEPQLLNVSITGNNTNCNTGNDGTATVIPSGGTAPYSFLWSNNTTTQSIVGLSAGTYTVVVTDNNGCATNGAITISNGSAINSTVTVTDATCGLCDGTASATNPTGGAGGYTYLWLPGGETTQSINNLCPGAYTLEVSDNAGCSQIFNVLINNPNGPSLTISSDSASCFGSCDGIASVVVNSGNAPYIYQWNDPLLTTNDTVSGLCAGFYSVIVQDDLGCISIDSTTVQEPLEILANFTFTAPNCDGTCDGTITANPTGTVGLVSFLWSNGQTSATATGFCAGTHSVTITDANNCSITDSITLLNPLPINLTISSTLPTCNSDCDATALVVATGGTPGYNYSWNTIPNQNNALATNLCSGNYIITVTDNNNCVDTASVQIIDPTPLVITSASTPPSCIGSCDGTATVNPTGGILPYTFIWNTSPTQTSATATGLCAGTYFVTIIDGNNCIMNDTITLSDPVTINDSTVITSPNCGICNGAATSTPIGGSGAYDFIWTDPVTSLVISTSLNQATSSVVGLCAGTVNLQITDLGSGCISNYTHIVNSVNSANIVLSFTDETCSSACDGTALATVSGGTAPYTYNWNTIPSQSDSNLINLCIGNYTVTITDSNGCISSDTVTIGTNNLNLVVTNVVPETCFGSCDGIAVVTANAGNSPYNYLWNPTGQATATATNLCEDLYTIVLTDALLCKDSISALVTGPNELIVAATINTPLACNGLCNGSLIATVNGGTAPYTYSWNTSPIQTTQIATNLCAGSYIVIVTDANGCSITDTVDLIEPSALVANENLLLPTCNFCDGQITLNPTGGVGPYTFLWTSPSTVAGNSNPIISNLCAGSYSVDITDVTNCVTTFNFALSNVSAPNPNTTATPVSCNGLCDGQLNAAPSGGISPYIVSWNPGGPTNPITNLCAGVYAVTVVDAVGCIGVSIDSITEPDPITANMTFTNISCDGSNDGSATANPTGGTPNYNYVWTPSQPNTNSVTNLTSGTQLVTITDANGCSVTDSVVILSPSTISSITTQTDATCSATCDGTATVIASGGSSNYSYEWNGNTTPGQIATQTGLCAGLNTVVITDQNGCSRIDTINIGAIDTVIANAGNDISICEGTSIDLIGNVTGTMSGIEWFELPGMILVGTTDTVSVSPSGVGTTCYVYRVNGVCTDADTVCVTTETAPIVNAGSDVDIFEDASTTLSGSGGGSFNWSPGNSLNDSTSATPNATPISTTTYVLTVTSASGCNASDSVTVTVLPKIRFADGITPNGDGTNDLWVIDFINEFPDNVVEIYNRWGELLFHADGYQQDWDGTYEGKDLPIGTYYYIIDLKDDSIKPFTGPITILR